MQSEHKRTLQFHNDTEDKCGILKTSRLHQSLEKLSKYCLKNDLGDCCSCAPLLDATSFENGYLITEELVCSAVSEERFYNSCATYISHTFSHGTTQTSDNWYGCEFLSMPHSSSL
jgi:hypothetical protein